MSQFIENLLNRNRSDNDIVHPRLMSKFESYSGYSNDLKPDGKIDQIEEQISRQSQTISERNDILGNNIKTQIRNSSVAFQKNIHSETKDNNKDSQGIWDIDSANSENATSIFNDEVFVNKKSEFDSWQPDTSKEDLSNNNSDIKSTSLDKTENTFRSDVELSFQKGDIPSFLESTTAINTETILSNKSLNNQTSNSPTIKVSIGIIEVKAIVEKTNATLKRKPTSKPKMSLQDYLDKQKKE